MSIEELIKNISEDDLTIIYKNLLQIKSDIIKMIRK